MAYYDFLNVVFGPLLNLPLWLAIIILSFIISVLVIVITKYTTNQKLMKELKDQLKDHQKQIKESKSNPSKAMELQKKAMEVNMKYMSHSLRPTLITFIPIILIFGWMSAVFAFESIHPQEQFTVTAFFDKNSIGQAELNAPEDLEVIGNKNQTIQGGKATWTLKGITEGEYSFDIVYNGETQQHSVLITSTNKYISSVKKTSGMIKSIQINYKKLVVIPIGFRDWLGWLGVYIWSSIIFTMGLRKIMKVY